MSFASHPNQDPNHELDLEHVTAQLDGVDIRLQIFSSYASVLRHLQDHFLDCREAWVDLLAPEERNLCKEHGASIVSQYHAYARCIREAVQEAACTPLHLHRLYWGPNMPEPGPELLFLSSRGVVVCARGGFVRTAYRNPRRGAFSTFIHSLLRAGKQSQADFALGNHMVEKACDQDTWAFGGWSLPRWRDLAKHTGMGGDA